MTEFDDIFEEMDTFYKKLMKKLFKEIDELEKTLNEQDIKTELSEIPELPQIPRYVTEEPFEPLTDIIEEKDQIKIYMELPAVDENDVQLTICDDRVEIKAKNFYKQIRLPTKRLAVERASATYRNGVLQVTIPKAKLFFNRSGKRHDIKLT